MPLSKLFANFHSLILLSSSSFHLLLLLRGFEPKEPLDLEYARQPVDITGNPCAPTVLFSLHLFSFHSYDLSKRFVQFSLSFAYTNFLSLLSFSLDTDKKDCKVLAKISSWRDEPLFSRINFGQGAVYLLVSKMFTTPKVCVRSHSLLIVSYALTHCITCFIVPHALTHCLSCSHSLSLPLSFSLPHYLTMHVHTLTIA